MITNTSEATTLKSKEFSDESIQPPSTFDNSLNAGTNYYHNSKIRIKFDGGCLKQDKDSHLLISK